MQEQGNQRFQPFDARIRWNELAEGYEHHRLLPDSFDALIEWPGQIGLVGGVTNKSMLFCHQSAQADSNPPHHASFFRNRSELRLKTITLKINSASTCGHNSAIPASRRKIPRIISKKYLSGRK